MGFGRVESLGEFFCIERLSIHSNRFRICGIITASEARSVRYSAVCIFTTFVFLAAEMGGIIFAELRTDVLAIVPSYPV